MSFSIGFLYCHKLIKLELNIGSFNQVPAHRFVINFRAKRLLLILSRLQFPLFLFLLLSSLSRIPHGLAHHKASKESCLTFCSIDLTSGEKQREVEREGERRQSLPNQFSCFLLCVICFLSFIRFLFICASSAFFLAFCRAFSIDCLFMMLPRAKVIFHYLK